MQEEQTGLEPQGSKGRQVLGGHLEDGGKCVYEKEGTMERGGKVWLHRRGWQCGMGMVGGRKLLVTKARSHKIRAEGAGCGQLGWCERRKEELDP